MATVGLLSQAPDELRGLLDVLNNASGAEPQTNDGDGKLAAFLPQESDTSVPDERRGLLVVTPRVGHISTCCSGVEPKTNDGDGLLSLQNWVHAQKEAGLTADAAQAFVREGGLATLVSCMKRNPGDTVVANRSLEILAGESYSNSSLPLVRGRPGLNSREEEAVLQELEKLGFVSVILNTLRLPDLQSGSRALGCRCLRHLALSSGASEILSGGGVEVLLAQVAVVDQPFAFAALAALALQHPDVQEQVRSYANVLPTLLLKFAEKPAQFSQAASPFFLSVWSWEELDSSLDMMGSEGEEVRTMLMTARSKQVTPLLYADMLFPFLDVAIDIYSTAFYYIDGEFLFFAIASSALIMSTGASTAAMTVRAPPSWKLVMNIVTFGSYALVSEVHYCIRTGFKTDELMGFAMIERLESFVSFCLGVYWILMSGYLEKYAADEGFALASRWLSVMSSLMTIPLGFYAVVMARMEHGKREFGLTYTTHIQASRASKAMLFLFQASELWSFVTFAIFELATRPDREVILEGHALPPVIAHTLPLVLVFGAQILVTLLALGINSKSCPSLSVTMPVCMNLICNISGGHNSELRFLSSFAAVLRVATLAVLWFVITVSISRKPALMEHLENTNSPMVLLAIAGTSSAMLLVATVQQFLVGRWMFDMEAMETWQVVSQVERSLTNTGIAIKSSTKLLGIYQTANDAPALVKSRWQKVHETLPTATARLQRAAFVEFHEAFGRFTSHQEMYKRFLNALFDAATALMYPKEKSDLGKHCFGYATLVHDEFDPEGGQADGLGLMASPAITWFDPLKVLRAETESDWARAEKDAKGYVRQEMFEEVLVRRHTAKFGGVSAARAAFLHFLGRDFAACRLLSGKELPGLDRHAFVYAALLAYEFYFADARDREMSTGCGSSTPVADSFGITSYQ
ncbi:unnamed protein product [Polarella glacialis]|uniref:Uncharacterized protein n=1 Tax=Polarella glacialis TaxID=89957 RepID=A0A813F0Q4_POLGL|nr:unnamed protein product [Polarella glacialis]